MRQCAVLVQRGIDRVEFKPLQAERIAIAITALYGGLALLCVVDPEAIQWEQIGETPLLLLLDGLAAPY